MSLQSIIIEGRIVPMAILTVWLAVLIISRFKYHSWVKYVGIIALVISLFLAACSFASASATIAGPESMVPSPEIIWSSVHTASVNIAYGLLIYLLSLIFRGRLKSQKHK